MGWTAHDLSSGNTPPAFRPPTAHSTEATQNVVYQGFTLGQGGNGSLHLLYWSQGTWLYGGDFTQPNFVGAKKAYQFTELASYFFSGARSQHINYTGEDHHIHEIRFDSDGWHTSDLSAKAHAPVPVLDGPSAMEHAGLQHVFYRGNDTHVHELWSDVAGWHWRDLTTLTGAPPVHIDTPVGYVFQRQATRHVVYVAIGEYVGGHVHELWRDSAGWHDGGNLNAITGAPVLAAGRPTGYAFEAQFTQHVFYRGTDGHIHELRWGTDTGGWHYWGNLTATTGAPQAKGDPYGYVFVPQDTQHVLYLGIDDRIHELWWDETGWHHNDLAARTGAPRPGSDPVGYVFGFRKDTQHVVYTAEDRRIIELVWSPVSSALQFLVDVTGEKQADIVAFGHDGVYVARGRGDGKFDPPQRRIAGLGYEDGWRVDRHVRLVGDLTNDGRADVVGFGEAGVYVALAAGGGAFHPPTFVLQDFGYDKGWRVDRHPRFLADVNGDGRADIVGFGNAGVYVALSNGNGSFQFSPVPVLENFGYVKGSWRVEKHPRLLADLRGIGIADIVGFGDKGVWVALGDGQGGFGQPQLVVQDFGYEQGWRVDRHPRLLADVNGDGLLDIVGFGEAGVYVALNAGGGAFHAPAFVLQDFGYNKGWRVDRHPRFLADVNGDGRADIVGFGNAGVYVAFGRTDGGFDFTPVPKLAHFGYAAGWRVDRNPRFLADLRGNGVIDIVGFGDVGVRTALGNNDGTFGHVTLAAPDFGREARAW